MVTLLVLLSQTSVKAQCAMCRAALESEPDGSMAEGVNDGIVFLMAMPYLLVGILFFFIYRRYRGGRMV